MHVYSEMYDGQTMERQSFTPHSWGVFPTLVFSFLAIMAVAWGLRSAETLLTPAAAWSQQESHRIPQSVHGRLHLGTMARALFGVETAQAATIPSFATRVTRQSDTSLVLRPGAEQSVTIRFKNIGSKTWKRVGAGYISLYTYEPKYRTSVFATDDWIDPTHPARIDQATVAPDGFATITVVIHAPNKPGKYTETFQLAAEDTAWVTGGTVKIAIEVVDPKTAQQAPKPVAITEPTQAPIAAASYHAIRLIQSHRDVRAVGNEDVTFRVGFKNTGTTPWTVREIRSLNLGIAEVDGPISPFAHASWLGGTRVVKLAQNSVPSGALDMYEFTFRTPASAGTYTAKFQLYVNDTPVDGGTVEIPVTVTQDASLAATPLVQFEGQQQLAPEPRIRVGVFKVEEPLQVRSPMVYRITSCSDTPSSTALGELPSNTTAAIFYSVASNRYSIEAPGISFIQQDCLRLEPSQPDSYFEITNHEDRPSWNKSLNFNTYRDTLEIRFSEKNAKAWFINELPIEQYVAGVAEASDYSPGEYHKALMTAVRTYAYIHLQSSKHADRHFNVDATYDQVYKGYAREKHFTRVADAVRATRGELVTYQGAVVVTPYYSQSDGRTRAWTEVWGGASKPWLVSVKADYDTGAKLWGHGVGMSAQDAADRAKNETIDYKGLLQYYYQGTVVERRYQ